MADTFEVQRSTRISASAADIFPKIGHLEGWDDWSPWAEMDPEMTKNYTGDSGAVGSTYDWSGNRKVGQGKMTLTDTRPDEGVTIDLEFIKPFKAQNVVDLDLAPDGDETVVTWKMTGQQTFMNKVMGVFGQTMDKMVGPDFEKGLAKLKTISEA